MKVAKLQHQKTRVTLRRNIGSQKENGLKEGAVINLYLHIFFTGSHGVRVSTNQWHNNSV